MCKLVTNVNTGCEFSSFKFVSNKKFSKLINSLFSPSRIVFFSCDFDFDGDWKIKELRKYAWTKIRFSLWTFTLETYNSLLRTLSQITNSPKFELSIEKWNLINEGLVQSNLNEYFKGDYLYQIINKESK